MNTTVFRKRKKEFDVKLGVARGRVVHVNVHALLLSPVTLSIPSFSHALLELRRLEF